jgi:hypothetical protein
MPAQFNQQLAKWKKAEKELLPDTMRDGTRPKPETGYQPGTGIA